MPMPGDELRPLLAAMERLVPGVRGCIGDAGPDEIAPGKDNRASVARLVSSVAARHPEAGPFFWSVRSWGLLEWQATALAVLGVYSAGLAAPVDRTALSVGDGTSFNHTLPPVAPERGPEALLVELAGRRLRLRADELLDELAVAIPVKRSLALRLLADRVLDFVVRANPVRDPGAPERLIASARLWLSAMRLEGASNLVPIRLGDGRVRPALDRRSCCLDYRIADGLCCASCPRLAPAERIERMRNHLEHHAGAR